MLNYDTLAAIVSAAVAATALWFSITEARRSRQHARITVRPVLSEDVKIDPSEQRHGLFLKNTGLGPAYVRSWTLLVDEKPYSDLGINRWQDLTKHLGIEAVVTYGYYKPGHVISVGTCDDLFTIEMTPYSADMAKKLRIALRRLTIRIRYQSIYAEETYTYEFIGSQYFGAET